MAIDYRAAVEYSARNGGYVKASKVDIERMLDENETGFIMVGANSVGHIAYYFGFYESEEDARQCRLALSPRVETVLITLPVSNGIVLTEGQIISSDVAKIIRFCNSEWMDINPSRITWCEGSAQSISVVDGRDFTVSATITRNSNPKQVVGEINSAVSKYKAEKDAAHKRFVASVEEKTKRMHHKSSPRTSSPAGQSTRTLKKREAMERQYGKPIEVGCTVLALHKDGSAVKGLVTSVGNSGFTVNGKESVKWSSGITMLNHSIASSI